jgi:hypothetical protein
VREGGEGGRRALGRRKLKYWRAHGAVCAACPINQDHPNHFLPSPLARSTYFRESAHRSSMMDTPLGRKPCTLMYGPVNWQLSTIVKRWRRKCLRRISPHTL